MSALPRPMKCQPVDVVPEGPEYLMQKKFDGWRGFLRIDVNGDITLVSSTGKSIHTVPYILSAFTSLPKAFWGTLLDGEVVNLDGSDEWNKAQSICSSTKAIKDYAWKLDGTVKVHAPTAGDQPLTFVAFDLLELMGNNLMGKPLEERLELLHTLYETIDGTVLGTADIPLRCRATEACAELPCTEASLEKIIEEDGEGVVVKRRDSPYIPGARGTSWLKIKPKVEIDVEITGMFDPDVGSKYEGNAVGGFEFNVVHDDGTEFNGRCGTGMGDFLRERMATHPQEFVGRVAVLKHWGIGKTGALRFPSLDRVRDPADKSVADLPEPVVDTAPPKSRIQEDMIEARLDAEEKADEAKAEAEELREKLRRAEQAVEREAPRAAPTNGKRRIRNYAAMGAPKLIRTAGELKRQAGEAWERCLGEGSGEPDRDLRVVEDLCRQKGINV